MVISFPTGIMQNPLFVSADKNQPLRDATSGHIALRNSPLRFQRTLSPLETWGFGLTAHVLWLSTAPVVHAALGSSAIFVWLPGVIVGMLLNLQVKRLGERWPDMVGGTPNYTTMLLKSHPGLARYAAIGYFFSWASCLPISAIIFANIIRVNLEPLGIACPDTLIKVGFMAITFVVAFSGTRALSILHLFFIIPAFGLLLAFCLQGLGWLAFSPASPGFFPTSWSHITFVDWAKWFFFTTYSVYSCETASSFVGDSRRPVETLRFLPFAASLMPLVFLGGSWVLMRLATESGMGNDVFLNLSAASKPFWGQTTALIVTFLVAAGCLLSGATVVSTCPRILYQLALDEHLSPLFAVVSRRGVLGPALVLTLSLGFLYLAWGDVAQIVVLGNTSWFVSIMSVHLGLWLCRGKPEIFLPWWSLGFFLVEAVVFVVGGLAWGYLDFISGMLCPIGILAADAAMRRLAFAPLLPAWWPKRYRAQRQRQVSDFVAFQVVVLILLVCSAVAVGWICGIRLNTSTVSSNLLVVLLLCVAFVGVAIACWTSLPQVISMSEAREAAEHLFTIALDAILVLDEKGIIRSSNPAAEQLFGVSATFLIGRQLNQLLPGLANLPQWPTRSEQTFHPLHVDSSTALHILEVAISNRFSQDASLTNQDLQEYVVILRDITERVSAEQLLQQANEELEIKVEGRTTKLKQTVKQLQMEIEERQRVEENLRAMQNQIIVQEKLASLGSLTAGIAHEIKNPLNFVNNFSELSVDLTQELFEEIENQKERLEPEAIASIVEILADLKQNFKEINQHGQRATSIVSNMLLHSRKEKGQWEATELNLLLAEYVNLAYQNLRSKDTGFNISIETDYDDSIGTIDAVPQDLGRVFLNIVNNACYAVYEKQQEMGLEFSSLLSVKTKNLGGQVEIRIRDNGKGITPERLDKIFHPFFTTKPAGQGTGLGLSISHDIVVQQHRGKIEVETEADSYAEFIIVLPKASLE